MTQRATHIVKARGTRPSEPFAEHKLHASIAAACHAVRVSEGHAEQIAEHVAQSVADWCSVRSEATSDDLRHVALRTLRTHHPEAAYLYSQQPHMV